MKGFNIEKFLNNEEICKNKENYYSIIIVISKIARDIVDFANDNGDICPDNPVEDAIESLTSNEYEIIKL